ncbi:MAG: hypothetical protein A2051_03090 [Desulfovibrionales bacterium GWA2_65_9]|nr:MAG: hypothetical protein A2051_03090 [Desulfovibrionales bacterium GWA2_65_9]
MAEKNKQEAQKAATGQDLHDLFMSVYHIHATLEKMTDLVHERSGMSTPWRRMLGLLLHVGRMTIPDIAARLSVSRQFVLKTCNDMADAGLIGYAENPRHKRSRLVVSTEEGRESFEAAKHGEREIICQVLPSIDADATREAAALLEDIRLRLLAVGLKGIGKAAD